MKMSFLSDALTRQPLLIIRCNKNNELVASLSIRQYFDKRGSGDGFASI
jgi:hypothetical protein